MKTGSVRAKAGDHVVAGQQLGELGFAGDALAPHPHYILIDNADVLKAEGLPPPSRPANVAERACRRAGMAQFALLGDSSHQIRK